MGDLILYGLAIIAAVLFAGCVILMHRADALEAWQMDMLREIRTLQQLVRTK